MINKTTIIIKDNNCRVSATQEIHNISDMLEALEGLLAVLGFRFKGKLTISEEDDK